MVDYHLESWIFLLLDVMGKSILASHKTRSVDVALLESLNASSVDQYIDHSSSDNGIRREYGFRTI